MNVVRVEIVIKNESVAQKTDLINLCKRFLVRENLPPGIHSKFNNQNDLVLSLEIVYIIVEDDAYDENIGIKYEAREIEWYIYRLDKVGPQSYECDVDDDDMASNFANLATYSVLPSASLFSLWENLIYDDGIKQNLLRYAETIMKFSDCNLNSNVITCNKVILLHGPPGTGKTSLCKALAHKLSIRLQKRYIRGVLIEINSHNLFSKWFSESGKLVTKMFNIIRDAVQTPKTLVCVIIDEIESLTHARAQCLSGNEPSDSLKVVNAVLTQIDQIRQHPNVIILTTSNITTAIDVAFVDRADIKQFIGLPNVQAIKQIYETCIEELIERNLIQHSECRNFHEWDSMRMLCEESVGLSGRMLRKIPFIAHALFTTKMCDLHTFIQSMCEAVRYEKNQKSLFHN